MIENIRLSFQGIWAHKMRSFLTMLGIIIGIAALISIVSTIELLPTTFLDFLAVHLGWDFCHNETLGVLPRRASQKLLRRMNPVSCFSVVSQVPVTSVCTSNRFLCVA